MPDLGKPGAAADHIGTTGQHILASFFSTYSTGAR